MSAATLDGANLQAMRTRFAKRGYSLQRVFRVGVDQPTYHVTRNTHTRIFNNPHDLASFLAVAEAMPV